MAVNGTVDRTGSVADFDDLNAELTDLSERVSAIEEAIASGSIVIRVPTDYATPQAALDHAGSINIPPQFTVTVLIEAGYEWPGMVVLDGGDFSRITISSDDDVVNVAATFPANDALFVANNCQPPVWNILVDMQGRGDNGVELTGSNMLVMHRKGVMNVGANGAPHREAWGSNFLLLGTSHLFCDPQRETVVERTGHTATGGTDRTFELHPDDQQADGYWIGHVIAVTNGVDTSDAVIVDYDGTTNVVTLKHSQKWSAPNDGAGLDYKIDLMRGLIASGGARRGVTITWASGISAVASDVRNCGTDPRDTSHVGFFFSRSSWGQVDLSTAVGSARGIRSARANRISARGAYLSYIGGTSISCAEGSSVSAAASDFRSSGLNGTGGLPDLSVLHLGSNEGRGGVGAIDAPGSEFDNAEGPVARVDSEAGNIDIGDSRAFEISNYLVTADGGVVDCTRTTGSTAPGAGAEHVLLASSLNSTIAALAFNWDAQGGANYILRSVRDGKVNLENSTLSNAAILPFDVDQDGSLYVANMTIDGVGYFPIGFNIRAACSIPSRQDAVDALALGWKSDNGISFIAGGERYIFDGGAGDPIPDMLSVVPLGLAHSGHFPTLQDWFDANLPSEADGETVHSVTAEITVPAGFNMRGTLVLDVPADFAGAYLTVGANVAMERLAVTIPGDHGDPDKIVVDQGFACDTLEVSADADTSVSNTIRLVLHAANIGRIVSRNISRPFNCQNLSGTDWGGGEIGEIDIDHYIRGIFIENANGWRIGRFKCVGAHPGAAKTTGHNGILIDACDDWSLGSVQIEDAGEHGFRIGGAGARDWHIGTYRFANIGGCPLKINPGDVGGLDERGHIEVIQGVGSHGAGPGGNSEFLRLTHVRDLSIGRAEIRATSDSLVSAQSGLTMNDVQGLQIGELICDRVQGALWSANETQDATPGPVGNIAIGSMSGSSVAGTNAIDASMGTQTLGPVFIGGGVIADLNTNLINSANIAGGTVGNFYLKSTVIGAVAPVSVNIAEDNSFYVFDLEYQGQRSFGGYINFKGALNIWGEAFDGSNVGNPAAGAMVNAPNVASAEGALGGSIGFTRPASNRRGAAIVSKQTGVNENQTGLAFYMAGGVVGTDAIGEKFQMKHNGDLEFLQPNGPGLLLESPDGSRWRATIDNTGAWSVAAA